MTTCTDCTFTPKDVIQCKLCKLTDDCLADSGLLDDVLAAQYPETYVRASRTRAH